jgi:hypothetical protein
MRRYARTPTTLAVALASWGDARRAYTQNISRGGLGFTIISEDALPAVGDQVTLALQMPDGHRFDLPAIVRYAAATPAGQSIGVEFADLKLEALLAIDTLIRKHPEPTEHVWLD